MSKNTMYWLTMMVFAVATTVAYWKDPMLWPAVSPWLVGAYIIAYLDKKE